MQVCKNSGTTAFSNIGRTPCSMAAYAQRGDMLVCSRESGKSRCRGSNVSDHSSYSSIRTFSTSSNNTACRTDSSSNDTLGSGTESTSDGQQFIWRTTERRFIDFCLSPEDERRLKSLHEKIVTSPSSSLSEEEITACILPKEEGEGERQLSLLQRLCHMGSYILSPRGLEEDGRRLFRTAIPLYENTTLTEKCFGISEGNFNGRIYFLLLHFWSLHCALEQAVNTKRLAVDIPAVLL